MISDWFAGWHRMLTCLLGIGVLSGGTALPVGSALPAAAAEAVGGRDVTEPYVVFVAHEAVYARCGPDGEYYRTDPLRLGQQLEVYLETDDGWLGIRPPDESFSWVLGKDIEVFSDDQQRGIVAGPKVVAWIGTHLGRARKYRWQVELPEGEEVAILGKTERQSKDGTETWYRIVPPSGEFRWVHRTQIVESTEQLVQMHRRRETPADRSMPSEGLANSDAQNRRDDDASATRSILASRSSELGQQGPRGADASEATRDAADELRQLDLQPIGSGVARTAYQESGEDRGTRVRLPRGRDNSDAKGRAPRPSPEVSMVVGNDIRVRDIAVGNSVEGIQPPAADRLANHDSWVTGSRDDAATAVATVDHVVSAQGSRASATGGLQPTAPPMLRVIHEESAEERAAVVRRTTNADVSELQLELSRQLAAGASARMVEPIRTRAAQLIDHLNDSVQRGHARLLLDRVEQYQRVARRRDGESNPAPSTVPRASQQVIAEPTDDADQPVTAGFVRTGYLVQVYSARPQAPPYALNDASGRTLAYVSPSLGIRLRNYLNQHVGLKGETTFDTGLNTPHIIASEAVPVRR